jgi:hypothetical protein
MSNKSLNVNNDATADAVKALFDGVDRYNERHTASSFIAASVMDLLRSMDEDVPKNQNTAPSFSDLIGEHADTLGKVGLVVKLDSDTIVCINDEERGTDIYQAYVDVEDAAKFLAFLKTLAPEQVTGAGGERLGKDIAWIMAVLVDDMQEGKNDGDPFPTAPLDSKLLRDIVAQYKTLDMAGIAEELEAYLDHELIGDLEEYRLVVEFGLLLGPGERMASAALWQSRLDPEFLELNWKVALEVLEMAKANPNAHDLCLKLGSHLKDCIAFAIECVNEFPAQAKADHVLFIDPEPLNERLKQMSLILECFRSKLNGESE